MRNPNSQSTTDFMSQPNECYWVALMLSMIEACLLFLGDRVEAQLVLVIPFRLLMFLALARCAQSSLRDQFSYRASFLVIPYMIGLILQYVVNSGDITVFNRLYYLSAFISLPLFDVVLTQIRSSDTLPGAFELVSLVALVVVSIIHVFFNDALVSFWASFLRDYLQAILRLTQLTLSSSDIAAVVRAVSHSMTGRVVISHMLSPVIIAFVATSGASFLRGERTPWFESWLCATMGWSTFWVSVFVLMSSHVALLLYQYLGVSMPTFITHQLSGCFDLIRFVPCIFGLSYCHYKIFQRNQSSAALFYASLFVFSVLGGMLYAPLAFIGLTDKAIGLRVPQASRKPSVPRSTT